MCVSMRERKKKRKEREREIVERDSGKTNTNKKSTNYDEDLNVLLRGTKNSRKKTTFVFNRTLHVHHGLEQLLVSEHSGQTISINLKLRWTAGSYPA